MSKFFKLTSDAPYHRHTYKLHLKSGKHIDFQDWKGVQEYWFTYSQMPDYLDSVEVLDKPKPKEKQKSKGFGS